MKTPSLDDQAVRVTAYLTDETFGYTHWRAAQFSAGPQEDSTETARTDFAARCRPAALVIFDTEGERDAFVMAMSVSRRP